jgi:ABC-type branched-subunit amino acid transport system substrate-binding protein
LAGISLLASLAACSSKAGSSAAPPTSAVGSSGGTLLTPLKVTGSISGPGVTPTNITIGDIATVTGPVPGLFAGANDGLDAWAAYVNAAGGIDGRQVKVVHLDDAFDCKTFQTDLAQLARQAFAVVGSFSVEDSCGYTFLKANPSVPYIPAAGLDPRDYSLPNMFAPIPNPPGAQTTFFNYIKSKFPNDITHTASLSSGQANPFELAAETVGYKYVYFRVIGPLDTNFTSDILRMKNDGVKIVDLLQSQVNTAAQFLQQAAQQNFHPDAVISVSAYDTNFLKLLGNASLAEHELYAPVFSGLYLGTDRATNPAVNTVDTWLARVHPSTAITNYAMESWAAAELFLQGLHNAGSQITQASLLSALSNIHNFDASGLLPPTDTGAKIGPHCVVIAGVVNGQWARLDPASGFDCNGVFHTLPLSALGAPAAG